MQKIKGVLQILGGLGLWAFGISIGVSWIALCFGTVVIGVLLLLFAPGVLLAPFMFGIVPGNAMLALGAVNLLLGDGLQDDETANQQAAKRDVANGHGCTPSWAINSDHREEFLAAIQVLSLSKGVPRKFIQEKLQDKELFRLFIQYSGALERHNSSFSKQQEAVADQLVKRWTKLESSEKIEYV